MTPPGRGGPLLDRWGQVLRRWVDPRYARERTLHNIGPKLLALAVALALWSLSTADRRANVEQRYDVPVTVVDSTGGRGTRATSALTPESVRVTLSGRPDRLRQLSGRSIEALVDVTGAPEGSFTRNVRVIAPTGTRVLRLEPERVQGFVDTELTRTLPVLLSVAAPSESSLPRFQVSPTQVQVSGPARVVTTVRRVVNTPVVLASGATAEVPLIALDAQNEPVEGVMTMPATATVSRLDSGEVPVKTVTVVLSPPPANLRVTSASVQPSGVRLVADPELLARLREVTGSVEYRVGTYTAPVRLQVPAGAQALENVTVRLTVEARPAEGTAAPRPPTSPAAP